MTATLEQITDDLIEKLVEYSFSALHAQAIIALRNEVRQRRSEAGGFDPVWADAVMKRQTIPKKHVGVPGEGEPQSPGASWPAMAPDVCVSVINVADEPPAEMRCGKFGPPMRAKVAEPTAELAECLHCGKRTEYATCPNCGRMTWSPLVSKEDFERETSGDGPAVGETREPSEVDRFGTIYVNLYASGQHVARSSSFDAARTAVESAVEIAVPFVRRSQLDEARAKLEEANAEHDRGLQRIRVTLGQGMLNPWEAARVIVDKLDLQRERAEKAEADLAVVKGQAQEMDRRAWERYQEMQAKLMAERDEIQASYSALVMGVLVIPLYEEQK